MMTATVSGPSAETGARRLLAVSTPARHEFPTGSYAWMIHGGELGHPMDPFLQIDHFRMAHPTFPPHPHAGMSAVTYMLDDAETGFVNRDSLGDRSEIHPGDLHWTQAGAGVMHEEIPIVTGQWAHGLQIFVNLAAQHKHAPPQAFHQSADCRPVVELAGGRLLVVSGEMDGRRAPVSAHLLTPVHIYDIRLEAGASVDIRLHEPTFNSFAIVMAGSLRVHTVELDAGMVGHFGRDGGDRIQVSAGVHGAWWLLMSGQPLEEPVFAQGPFVGNSPADIGYYRQRFLDGHMGSLKRSF